MPKLFPIQVVHIAQPQNQEGLYIYIGRPGRGRTGSPLANPFRMQSETERQTVIAKYKKWLHTQLKEGTPQQEELRKIASMCRITPVYLVCFCAPKSCHGDIIKTVIESECYQ